MIGLLIVAAALFVFIAIHIFYARSNANSFRERIDREPQGDLYGEFIERVSCLIGEDMGVPSHKIYPSDNLRKDLGYDIDAFGGCDGFDDLVSILKPLGLNEDLLNRCETVGDIANECVAHHRKA